MIARKAIAAIAVLLPLAACQNQQSHRTPPRDDIANVVFEGPVEEVAATSERQNMLNYLLYKNASKRLVSIFYINQDCTPAGIPKVDITETPVHGRVDIVPVVDTVAMSDRPAPQGTTTYQNEAENAKCGHAQFQGVEIDYTANSNFVGKDHFKASIIRPDGEPGRQMTFNMIMSAE